MSAPDFNKGYLRVPHAVWQEVFCRAPLSRRQLQLVAVVIRESWGWTTASGEPYLWSRPLPRPRLVALTGISSEHVGREVRHLLSRGVLLQQGGSFQFVADPDRWDRPASLADTPAQLAGLQSEIKTERKEKSDVLRKRGTVAHADTASRRTARAAQFVRVVEACVGSLSPVLRSQLHAALQASGPAAVWSRIGPAFGGPSLPTEDDLLARLAAHSPRENPSARP